MADEIRSRGQLVADFADNDENLITEQRLRNFLRSTGVLSDFDPVTITAADLTENALTLTENRRFYQFSLIPGGTPPFLGIIETIVGGDQGGIYFFQVNNGQLRIKNNSNIKTVNGNGSQYEIADANYFPGDVAVFIKTASTWQEIGMYRDNLRWPLVSVPFDGDEYDPLNGGFIWLDEYGFGHQSPSFPWSGSLDATRAAFAEQFLGISFDFVENDRLTVAIRPRIKSVIDVTELPLLIGSPLALSQGVGNTLSASAMEIVTDPTHAIAKSARHGHGDHEVFFLSGIL